MAIAALGWLGMQLFTQLYTLVALLNHHALVSPSHIRLVGWGAPTIALVALLALSADFGALLAGHAAFGRPIASLAWTLVAIGCTAHGALVLAITLLRARRLRVGYKPPASSDADAFDALRSLLARTVPLVIVADAFISGAVGLVLAVSFSRVAIAALWLVVGANIVQAILTLRVLNCKQLVSKKKTWPTASHNKPPLAASRQRFWCQLRSKFAFSHRQFAEKFRLLLNRAAASPSFGSSG